MSHLLTADAASRRLVVLVNGLPAAGKTTLARALSRLGLATPIAARCDPGGRFRGNDVAAAACLSPRHGGGDG